MPLRGRATTDIATGEISGRLRSRGSAYLMSGASVATGDGTFTQNYVLDVGPFLTAQETQTATIPLRRGGVIFLSTAEITTGGSGSLSYIGRSDGTTARYSIFGRVCGWGPDLVLTNGEVHTVSHGIEEAVAVQDGRIIAVGSDVDILDVFIAGSTPEVIDVQGRVVIPAFVDAHSHAWEDRTADAVNVEAERFEQGVTTQGEPTTKLADIAALQALADTGDLNLRTRTWTAYNDVCNVVLPGDPAPHLATTVSRDPGDRFAVLGTKIFADGGVCQAPAISFPYLPGLDDPLPASPQGDLYLTPGEMAAVIATADAAGHQVIIHAIGDVGVATAVDALGQVIDGNGNPNRHRIDHNTLVRPELFAEYLEHDIGAVAFGEYRTCRHNAGGWWGQHLDPANIDWLYPWRDMVDAGITLGWQADAPYFTANSMHQWHALASLGQAEEDPAFSGPGPCTASADLASHGLGVTDALAAMTLGSATLLHLDTEVGSIEVGKAADLVIIDENPFGQGPDALLNASVMWTMTRGHVVYCDPAAALGSC